MCRIGYRHSRDGAAPGAGIEIILQDQLDALPIRDIYIALQRVFKSQIYMKFRLQSFVIGV
jgi:hypothetical protein